MITRVEVDGFKTLNKFVFEPKPGLNILVGPNGVGKSNILQFFEFLALLSHKNLSEAVQEMGGSLNVFQKIGDKKFNDTIKITVEGNYKLYTEGNLNIEFVYEIEIKTQENKIFYNSQELKFRYNSDSINNSIQNDKEYDFHIKYEKKENSINLKDNFEIKNYNIDNIRRYMVLILHLSKEQFKERIIYDIISSENSDPSSFSIVKKVSFLLGVYQISFQFRTLNFYNINPDIAKLPNEYWLSPIIQKNGFGLAAKLFDLKPTTLSKNSFNFDSQDVNSTPRMIPVELEVNNYKTIEKFLQDANENILQLDVRKDDSENKIKIMLTIKSEGYECELPLSSMSDGTIKWLTLITAIICSANSFCLEEPENFLHPWMQDVLLTTIREQLDSFERPAFVLITTHSETVINFSQPEEIILVDFQNGCTSAKYVSNKNELKAEISRSGNRLGYFYFSNSLIPHE